MYIIVYKYSVIVIRLGCLWVVGCSTMYGVANWDRILTSSLASHVSAHSNQLFYKCSTVCSIIPKGVVSSYTNLENWCALSKVSNLRTYSRNSPESLVNLVNLCFTLSHFIKNLSFSVTYRQLAGIIFVHFNIHLHSIMQRELQFLFSLISIAFFAYIAQSISKCDHRPSKLVRVPCKSIDAANWLRRFRTSVNLCALSTHGKS